MIQFKLHVTFGQNKFYLNSTIDNIINGIYLNIFKINSI